MRTCWAKNRSKQCTRSAIHGDYCVLHSASTGAVPYSSLPRPPDIGATAVAAAADRIKAAWTKHGPARVTSTRGPYSESWAIPLATNKEEFATFDELHTIPPVYRFTYVEPSTHTLWWFDIRSLAASPRRANTIINPYTRCELPPHVRVRFDARMQWLIQRRYNRAIPPPPATSLTANQWWSLRIMEVFYNFDQLGFLVSPTWFEELTPPLHSYLRYQLEELWRRRIPRDQREAIIPGITEMTGGTLFRGTLFPGIGADTCAAETLRVIERLLTASADKTQRVVGALYCLAALTTVSRAAHQTYPWLFPGSQ